MLREDKELLLKDLCARLPYGVIVAYKSRESEVRISLGYGNIGYVAELGRGWWTDCKPYLRPMSSMTEEEKKNYHKQVDADLERTAKSIKERFESDTYNPENQFTVQYYHIDWLNAHHFDYRELIEKGLAIEVTEENNPYKNYNYD